MVGKALVGFGNFLCSRRSNWFVKNINKAIRILYFKIENDNYSLDSNGESRVIKALSKLRLNTFFDVGANHGEWTLKIKQFNPTAFIHSFEASPITFKILKHNVQDVSGIVLINKGLFDKKGFLDFHQNSDDGLSSLISSSQQVKAQKLNIEVTTIDDYLIENNLEEIDFLKIDTEGADYNILKGAHRILSQGKVKVIQFEYGFVSVDTGYLLKDHYSLLEQYGFTLGKIYPDAVDFSPYSRDMENFIGPNFLAVRNDLKEIIQLLK